MKRIFSPDHFETVSDGTQLSPLLNPTDANADDAVAGLPGEVSMAAGRMAPGTTSWIHAHPVVTQVTYVVAGALTATMQDRAQPRPYQLLVATGSAVVTEPGTLLQLRNETAESVELLYIVSPAYVFEVGRNGGVIYDDAILVAENWDSLTTADWDAYDSEAARAATQLRRAQALQRLAARRQNPDP